MVPRWGVLYSVEKILDRRYSGRVFVREGATGHLFNQHYLGGEKGHRAENVVITVLRKYFSEDSV